MPVSRRKFLQGCCAGIVALNGAQLGGLVFGQNALDEPRDIIISLFLRGGMDALSLLAPHSDANYHVARNRLALDSNQVIDLDGQFGLHPAAQLLKDLVDQNHLALVMACGSTHPTRSHFEAQDAIERGKPGDRFFTGGGWLARHLAFFPSEAIFRAVSRDSSVDISLEGLPGALAISGPGDFSLNGHWNQIDDTRRALREMYEADPDLGLIARNTLDAVDIVDHADPGQYVPGHGVVYPENDLAEALASIAQLIRLDLGLQAATVNFGGWDTHEDQTNYNNPTTGYFAGRITTLSEAFNAFWSDLADYHGRLTLVMMTEFGRRLRENANLGTDHGYAGLMAVMSSNLTRGGLFGTWPGLAEEQLFERVDLMVTTDFRTVLGEVLTARAGNQNLAQVFPDFTYPGPLGLFAQQSSIQPKTLEAFLKNKS